ncbi:HD domain-containing protein [Trichocoleus sp. FACHB-591]|uniref:HD domain-containing protein n=1 Tax=Trichocoleus sp. FACHB-591 TaxID=2692872 RepID=UPI0016868B1C|nr:HD domain-containing protein [Trichocoleus sp. FACHB-591]
MLSNRLTQQIAFIVEIDKLKQILRQTLLINASRQENSAEHSWHITLMAIVLAEYAPEGVNLLHAVKLLLLHDLVEIDAGDTFCYDLSGNQSKAERELAAADRLFGLLPPDQGTELRSLWEEFEAQVTPEAKFAAALDRLQPILNNQQTGGASWKKHGIRADQVLWRMQPVLEGAPELWPLVEQIVADCVAAGYLQQASQAESVIT